MSFDIRGAIRRQNRLAARVILAWDDRPVRTVAGADVAYDRVRNLIVGTIVVCRTPGLEILDTAWACQAPAIPYIPGFLSFREGPVFVQAYRRLSKKPDVTILDGNGIAHPRKIGLASHIGVLLDIPTIGCAKSPFFPFEPPGKKRGEASAYCDRRGERVGDCLRTRDGVKPVFVSPGHRIDLVLAREIVLACARFRLPEPLRLAHALARDLLRRS